MRFSLDQFEDVLRERNSTGRPYVIIGGQAVNYWATRYLAHEPALSTWQPFTSKDIDFCGDRNDVIRMAKHLGRPAKFPHKKMMTAFAGGISWPIGENDSNIEFIRRVPGVTAEEVEKLAVEHDYLRERIRVIDPVSLLACKLDLALTVNQSNRRDDEHARILLLCVRAFLREILTGVELGELPARGWLGAVERLLTLAESTIGRKAATKLDVDWIQVLPDKEIDASQHRLIVRFREQRLPQWMAKINRRDKGKRNS